MSDSVEQVPACSKRQRHVRRRVVYVNDVDQHLIDQGLRPSWEDRVDSHDQELLRQGQVGRGSSDDSISHEMSGDDDNTIRLQEDIPPHSHVKL